MTVNEAGNTAWDGTAETSWYNTTDTYYELSTPEQFAGFAKIVSGTVDGIAADSFAGKTVLLMTDLDLGSKPWTAVGLYSSNPFAGTFDGNGKKISNFLHWVHKRQLHGRVIQLQYRRYCQPDDR